MSTSILATKLYIPSPRPEVVSRPRLIERLNDGLHRKLTLISAPAGFGKTTLVSEWLSQGECSTAWLSLDDGDNDLARFLVYLVAALQTVEAKVGRGALAMLQASQPPVEAVLTTLLNELAAISDHFVLILDDYHAVDVPAIHDALTFLIEHLPPHLHLVLATREDPPLPLARWRGRGQLTELRAADLRFTAAEAAEFLNRVMGLQLSSDDVARLESRTEGWITGLQLAALSLQGRSDTARYIQAFSGSQRFVLDYLIEEVLQRQPEGVRRFLLHTAILDRLSGGVCDAVTGRDDGQVTLEALERSNLFVIPLDDRRLWYRYHHLFADVLRARLLEEPPDQVSVLHRRASVWYERNGLPSGAIHHALAAGDFERAADLVELAGPIVEESAQAATWLGWVRALPDALIRVRPVLSGWYALGLLGRGAMEAAEDRLADAERWLEAPAPGMVVADEAQLRALPATLAVARAYYAQALGDVPGTVKYAQRVLDLLPEGDHLRRGQATALLGLTCWASGDLEGAQRAFADFIRDLRAAGNLPDAVSAAQVLAELLMGLGRLRDAVTTLAALRQFVVQRGDPMPPDMVDLYRGLGELYLEQGEFETAAQLLLRSKELGEQVELPGWRYRWCMAQARLDETQGRLEDALHRLEEAAQHFVRSPLPNVVSLSAMQTRISVRQGRLADALDWARAQRLSVDDDLSYLREFEHITLARVLIARYRHQPEAVSPSEVLGFLHRLLTAAEEGRRVRSVIEILVLQALAHEAQDRIPPALVALERALSLAEPEGYVRVFVVEGAPLERLLRAAAQQGIHPDYVSRLRAAWGPAPDRTPVAQPLIEPLSERELEVLKLLGTELDGPDIARLLVVSLSTVRTHTQNIYSKLGVNNRRAAVRRAEELHLL